jgi:transcriptional regulator with XRE-family HTH domain
MPITPKDASLRDQRRLLRRFLKEYGISLGKFEKHTGLSKATLSRFISGDRNMSERAWANVLKAMNALISEDATAGILDAASNRFRRIHTAQKTAAKLGTSVALSIHSQTLSERVKEFVEKNVLTDPAKLTERELREMLRDALEIVMLQQGEWRAWKSKADFYEKWISENVTAKKIEELQAFKDNVLALNDEHLPAIASAKLESAEVDPLAHAKAKHAEEMRRLGFTEGDK